MENKRLVQIRALTIEKGKPTINWSKAIRSEDKYIKEVFLYMKKMFSCRKYRTYIFQVEDLETKQIIVNEVQEQI